MKIYLIKHTGKTQIGNFIGLSPEMTVGSYKCWINYSFFRKKDAQKYLETFQHKEYLEVISAEVKKSKKDNRKI